MNQINEIKEAIAEARDQGELFSAVGDFIANADLNLGLGLNESYETAAKIAYDNGRPEIGEVLVDAFHKWIALDDRDQQRQ